MSNLTALNLCRSCPDETYTLDSDSQMLELARFNEAGEEFHNMKFIRQSLFLRGDCKQGIITLKSAVPLLNDEDFLMKGVHVVNFTVDPGSISNPGQCDETCTPDHTYTELWNRLENSIKSCCGGIAQLASTEMILAGTLNTVLNSTVVEAGDSLPDVLGVAQVPTWALLAGSEVGGTAVVAGAGTFSFTPATPTTTYGEFVVQMFQGADPVGSKTIKINFS